jgi:hypothetical protein
MGEPHGRVSVGENKYSWMNGGQMGGWMNGARTLAAEARALCIIYGHLTFSLRPQRVLFLALPRGSECMPMDSRIR